MHVLRFSSMHSYPTCVYKKKIVGIQVGLAFGLLVTGWKWNNGKPMMTKNTFRNGRTQDIVTNVQYLFILIRHMIFQRMGPKGREIFKSSKRRVSKS